MPKAYIQKQATDIIYLRNYYKKLIKCFIFFYIIIGIILSQIFFYTFYSSKNDYFVVTTFGKLIEIIPQDSDI